MSMYNHPSLVDKPILGLYIPTEEQLHCGNTLKDKLEYEEYKRQLEAMYANLKPFAFTLGYWRDWEEDIGLDNVIGEFYD